MRATLRGMRWAGSRAQHCGSAPTHFGDSPGVFGEQLQHKLARNDEAPSFQAPPCWNGPKKHRHLATSGDILCSDSCLPEAAPLREHLSRRLQEGRAALATVWYKGGTSENLNIHVLGRSPTAPKRTKPKLRSSKCARGSLQRWIHGHDGAHRAAYLRSRGL